MSKLFILFAFVFATLVSSQSNSQQNDSLPAPEEHPLCSDGPVKKVVASEVVISKWPNGSTKVKTIKYADRTWVQYHYFENGQIELESYYNAKNSQDGTQRRWKSNGALFVCSVYEDGKKSGTWIYRDEQGQPMSSFTYKDDVEIDHLTYSKRFGWQKFK